MDADPEGHWDHVAKMEEALDQEVPKAAFDLDLVALAAVHLEVLGVADLVHRVVAAGQGVGLEIWVVPLEGQGMGASDREEI